LLTFSVDCFLGADDLVGFVVLIVSGGADSLDVFLSAVVQEIIRKINAANGGGNPGLFIRIWFSTK
jgi:hypothetical protein